MFFDWKPPRSFCSWERRPIIRRNGLLEKYLARERNNFVNVILESKVFQRNENPVVKAIYLNETKENPSLNRREKRSIPFEVT